MLEKRNTRKKQKENEIFKLASYLLLDAIWVFTFLLEKKQIITVLQPQHGKPVLFIGQAGSCPHIEYNFKIRISLDFIVVIFVFKLDICYLLKRPDAPSLNWCISLTNNNTSTWREIKFANFGY